MRNGLSNPKKSLEEVIQLLKVEGKPMRKKNDINDIKIMCTYMYTCTCTGLPVQTHTHAHLYMQRTIKCVII